MVLSLFDIWFGPGKNWDFGFFILQIATKEVRKPALFEFSITPVKGKDGYKRVFVIKFLFLFDFMIGFPDL